jgi:hypothetical protein
MAESYASSFTAEYAPWTGPAILDVGGYSGSRLTLHRFDALRQKLFFPAFDGRCAESCSDGVRIVRALCFRECLGLAVAEGQKGCIPQDASHRA